MEKAKHLIKRTLARIRKKHYSNFDEEEWVQRYVKEQTISCRYAIDIAGGDGFTMSNSYRLFRDGWSGLVVECDGLAFSRLASLYRHLPSVALARCKVTPENIRSLLQAHGAPAQPGFLSLDIDGYDFYVLDALLAHYRPLLLCVEINEKIPPPIKFTVKYDPAYGWSEDHFYGQSIAQLDLLCHKYRYAMMQLCYNNVFLIPEENAKGRVLTAVEAYREGYLNRTDRRDKFSYNEDFEAIHQLAPAEALTFVNNKFSKYAGKFECTL